MSGSENSDSDCGIRFKTANTRNQNEAHSSLSHRRSRNEDDRDRHYRKKKSYHQDRKHSTRHKHKRSRSPRSPKRSPKSSYSEGNRIKKRQDEEDKNPRNSISSPDSDNLKVHSVEVDDENDCQETYGPVLPPRSVKNPTTYGPQLPSKEADKKTDNKEEEQIYGPQIPSQNTTTRKSITAKEEHFSDDQDDDMIGPLPPGAEPNHKINTQLEIRALELKLKKNQAESSDLKNREEWMLQLPDVKLIPDLSGPRTFRPNAGPDFSDRTSWTDTPEDKIKKQKQTKDQKIDPKVIAELQESEKRDKEQERIIKDHKKKHKRDETLLEIHRKEQSKKNKEVKSTERRPFNRDTDLQLTRIDAAQKDAMIRKAMLLDDRFSAGKSKFL